MSLTLPVMTSPFALRVSNIIAFPESLSLCDCGLACRKLLGHGSNFVERTAARRLGGRHDGALDNRRVTAHAQIPTFGLQHLPAISLLVSAPPRSTRMATPLGDHALLMASIINDTLVPRPPSGSPPQNATLTSLPTIWRTMSAVPLAMSLECDTMTIPTVSFMAGPPTHCRRHAKGRSSSARPDRRGRRCERQEKRRGPCSPASAPSARPLRAP